MNTFLLDFLCLGAILSAILVIQSKNPVLSVLFLISVFLNVCGYLVLLGLGFIGISYVIVYVGAIAILFLFVVIILNLELAELSALGNEYTKNLVIAQILGTLFLFEIVRLMPKTNNFDIEFLIYFFNSYNSIFLGITKTPVNIHVTFNSISNNFQNFLEVQRIANVLYRNCIIWLILCSIILCLAIVSPITLSINKKLNPFSFLSWKRGFK